ncbi:MAG: hypothetical protein KGI38_12425, partial [Thaumarchaeota archaeon]|nr:hypothetical protein [Nitrososphaerota archaeon]
MKINDFTVNGKNFDPSSLSCVPQPPSESGDTLSWSATPTDSCSNYTPDPVTDCNGSESWSLTSPSTDTGSCSISSSNGYSSGQQGTSGTLSLPVPDSSTDYVLSCTRPSYSCTWERPSYTDQSVPGTTCTTAANGKQNCVTTYKTECLQNPDVTETYPS